MVLLQLAQLAQRLLHIALELFAKTSSGSTSKDLYENYVDISAITIEQMLIDPAHSWIRPR